MSRQEATARRTRKGAAQAEEAIARAIRRIKCRECSGKGTEADGVKTIDHAPTCSRYEKPAQKAATPRQRARAVKATPATPQPGTVDLAAECKQLRETGMAWWRIGWELKLPGCGETVATGKSGAAQARKLYAQANGGQAAPSTRAPSKRTPRANQPPKHAGNLGTKTDRKITLVERGHVIPTDLPDEEVLAMVRGRTIEWGINVSRLAGSNDDEVWSGQEARVHPDWLVMEEDLSKDGSRVIRFREFLGRDDQGKLMSGPTRTVRVNAIHTVR